MNRFIYPRFITHCTFDAFVEKCDALQTVSHENTITFKIENLYLNSQIIVIPLLAHKLILVISFAFQTFATLQIQVKLMKVTPKFCHA